MNLKVYLHASPIWHQISWFTKNTKYLCFQKCISILQHWTLKLDVYMNLLGQFHWHNTQVDWTTLKVIVISFVYANHRHLIIIDCLTVCTACLVCFISTVNGRSNKKRKEKKKLTLRRPALVAVPAIYFGNFWYLWYQPRPLPKEAFTQSRMQYNLLQSIAMVFRGCIWNCSENIYPSDFTTLQLGLQTSDFRDRFHIKLVHLSEWIFFF